MNVVNRLFSWLDRVLSDERGHPSTKRLAYLVSCGVFLGVTIGLAVSLSGSEVRAADTLEFLVGTVALMVTTGYVGGKAISSKNRAAENDKGSAPDA